MVPRIKYVSLKLCLVLATGIGVSSLASSAAAEEPATNQQSPAASSAAESEVEAGDITIVGRVQRPIAAVDVARIPPKMTLAKLRQPFLDRIEQAIYRAPF